jgi:hypothetical protein
MVQTYACCVNRLKLKRGKPIDSNDEDEFEVKGRDTMRRFQEALEAEELKQRELRNRPIPVLSESIGSPIKLPTTTTGSTNLAPAATASGEAPKANSSSSSTAPSSSHGRAPLSVNHTNNDDDDLPDLIEQTLPVCR